MKFHSDSLDNSGNQIRDLISAFMHPRNISEHPYIMHPLSVTTAVS